MSIVSGWAIKEGGTNKILPNTVSATRRAAIVNWLVTAVQLPVTNDWSDEQIEQVWRLRQHVADNTPAVRLAEAIEIEIREKGK